MSDISNADDTIDSRDVIARIEELESDYSDLLEAAEGLDGDELREAQAEINDWNDSEGLELEALRKLAKEGEDYAPDWLHGETLIRDSYFEDYAQELAEDIGAINSNATWPNNCIDWERAARELRMDYTSIDFDGVTYWIR